MIFNSIYLMGESGLFVLIFLMRLVGGGSSHMY